MFYFVFMMKNGQVCAWLMENVTDQFSAHQWRSSQGRKRKLPNGKVIRAATLQDAKTEYLSQVSEKLPLDMTAVAW